jgi:mRNA-degrading endonuclease RelE of RelBE toxin-antitoxin system
VDSFVLTLSPSAVRDLDRLDDKAVRSVFLKLPILEKNPFPKGKLIKKIRGKKSVFYRLRVGKYRVFYFLAGREVVILKVIDKKDADKFIKGKG